MWTLNNNQKERKKKIKIKTCSEQSELFELRKGAAVLVMVATSGVIIILFKWFSFFCLKQSILLTRNICIHFFSFLFRFWVCAPQIYVGTELE